jgi:hypothetical protein
MLHTYHLLFRLCPPAILCTFSHFSHTPFLTPPLTHTPLSTTLFQHSLTPHNIPLTLSLAPFLPCHNPFLQSFSPSPTLFTTLHSMLSHTLTLSPSSTLSSPPPHLQHSFTPLILLLSPSHTLPPLPPHHPTTS